MAPRPPIGATSALDNPGVYQRLKEAHKAAAQSNAGRVTRARADAAQYQREQERGRQLSDDLQRLARELEQEGRDLGIPMGDVAAQPDISAARTQIPKVRDIPRSAVPVAERRPKVRADDESAQWRYGPVGVSLGGYAGLVDERIQAAREKGQFRNNPLHGKPLARDLHDANPYLPREEYLMNRLVQRQGAAPPWVEANSDLDRGINLFRSALTTKWVHHAARLMTSGQSDADPSAQVIGTPLSDSAPIPLDVVKALPDSLEGLDIRALPPLPITSGGPGLSSDLTQDADSDEPKQDKHLQVTSVAALVAQTRSPDQALDALRTYFLARYVISLTCSDQPLYPPGIDGATLTHSSLLPPGEPARIAMLWARVSSFRDAEWERRNEALHTVQISDLNRKIMRYNALAPFHARRGLLTRQAELERAFASSHARLAIAVSQELRMIRSSSDGAAASSPASLFSSTTKTGQRTGILSRFASWLEPPSGPTSKPSPRSSSSAGPAKVRDESAPRPSSDARANSSSSASHNQTHLTAVDALFARLQKWRS